MYSESGPNDQLMHYGVLGMKWGHRKMPYRASSHNYRREPSQTELDQQAAAFRRARSSDGTKNPFKIMTRMVRNSAIDENRKAELRKQLDKYDLSKVNTRDKFKKHAQRYAKEEANKKSYISEMRRYDMNKKIMDDQTFNNYLLMTYREVFGAVDDPKREDMVNEYNAIKKTYG